VRVAERLVAQAGVLLAGVTQLKLKGGVHYLGVDAGMNSLIVNDISKNIEKVVAMVTELDRKIKQVEIVAKLVDVDYDWSREIGVVRTLSIYRQRTSTRRRRHRRSTRGARPGGSSQGRNGCSRGARSGDARRAGEKENKANIISNPRIVTAENREASILVGKEIPLIVSDEAGNPITELTKIGIILRVTPHVNLDNSITLDLHPEVSDLAAQATVQGGVVIMMSEATRVIVGDGNGCHRRARSKSNQVRERRPDSEGHTALRRALQVPER
jgi:type IV pilus assembly protein PilQ